MAIWRYRDVAAAGCCAIALGVGVWCTFARLDVATVGGFRVAMFPPWWVLVAAIVVVFFVLSALPALPALRAHLLRARAFVALPALLALPYLPWLPDAFPILRALAGPGRWIVWAVIATLVVFPRRFAGPIVPHRPTVIFAASAVVIGLAAMRLTDTPLHPGGDEPHYLIITQSLLNDRDLEIANNHARQDYAAYFHAPLDPHSLALGKDGRIYSVHPIGLPVVVAPIFAAAGYHGVVWFLVVLSSAVAAFAWQKAFAIAGSAAATFGWAATCLTAPYLFNAFAVYPEVAAAACVLAAFPWAADEGGWWVARGLALAALPWLSSKYIAMALVLALIAVSRARSVRFRALVIVPFALSVAGWLWFFYWIWGSPSPAAPYGGDSGTHLSTLAAGAPGLWFDQEYGLLPYAPVLLMAFPGLLRLWRDGHARLAIEIVLVVGALLGAVGAFHIWWGGSSAPGRPVIAALPLLALPIAYQFRAAEGLDARRAAQMVLLVVSIGIAAVLLFAQEGLLLANDRSGSARWLAYFSVAGELPRAFPTFIAASLAAAIGRVVVWLGAAAIFATAAARLKSPTTTVVSMIVAVAAASTITSTTSAALETRTSSAMLDSFDRIRRPIGVAYDPFRRLDADRIPSLFPLAAAHDIGRARFSLPAGAYAVEFRPTDEMRPPQDALVLTVGRQRSPLRSWNLARVQPNNLLFDLPVDVGWIGFQLTPREATPFQTVRITPQHIVDAGRRTVRRPVLQASPFGDIDVFFEDDNVFVEPAGFWTRGGSSAAVTMRRNRGGQPIRLRIHGGPVANRVRLHAGNWQTTIDLVSGNPKDVTLPPQDVLQLVIDAEHGFVPSAVDRFSADRRFLGVWVEPS